MPILASGDQEASQLLPMISDNLDRDPLARAVPRGPTPSRDASFLGGALRGAPTLFCPFQRQPDASSHHGCCFSKLTQGWEEGIEIEQLNML